MSLRRATTKTRRRARSPARLSPGKMKKSGSYGKKRVINSPNQYFRIHSVGILVVGENSPGINGIRVLRIVPKGARNEFGEDRG